MNHNTERNTQPNLGETSRMKVSCKRGIEAWFDVDDITIRFWGAPLSGREIVTVRNGGEEQVVSDLRSFSFRSQHHFDYGGHRYRIDFKGVPGKADIDLYRNDQLIDSDEFRGDNLPIDPETGRLDWPAALKKLAPIMVIGAAAGAVFGYFFAQVMK